MSSYFLLVVVAGAARPLLKTGRRRHPPDGRPDWLTRINVRSAVNCVCRRADTAYVVWLTLRTGSASRGASFRRRPGCASHLVAAPLTTGPVPGRLGRIRSVS